MYIFIKRFNLFCLLLVGLSFLLTSFAALPIQKEEKIKFPMAKIRNTKTYKGSVEEYGPSGQIKVKEWVINAKHSELGIITLEGADYYAVDPDRPSIMWLNQHTPGNISSEFVPIHDPQDQHLELFALHPGLYYLHHIRYNKVASMDGYKLLKKDFGDRVQLVEPIGPGHYVGIRILPPNIKSTH